MKKAVVIFFLFAMHSAFAQAPANDNCTTPQVVVIPASGNICLSSTNINATTDLSTFTCQTGNDNDVWFVYTATGVNNTVTITPNGATPAQQVAVSISNANCAAGTFNVCNASATNGGTATATWSYPIGAQVLVNVATNGASGTFLVCITSVTPPPAPGSSCNLSNTICNLSNFSVSPFPANANGLIPPCFFGSMQRPLFYRFTVGVTGTCAWTATPLGATEYDWAMYDITNGCPGTLSVCNYNYALGVGAPIGLNAAATVACPTSGAAGPLGEYCQPITVIAGRTYLIVIDNYGPISNAGFNFSWAGSTFQMAPTAAFTVIPTNACNSALAIITNTSVPAGNTYSWNFGDGTTSAAANPPAHNYPTPGTFLISVVATAASGCTSTGQGSVTVNSVPSMTAPANITVCSGTAIAASNFVSSPTGATFQWVNSNPAIGLAASGTGNVPAFIAVNNTGVPITSTIAVVPSRNGCSGALVSYTITVNPVPPMPVAAPVVYCENAATAVLTATGSNLLWYTSSAGGIGSATPPTPAATPAGTTNYYVSQTINGCESARQTLQVTVVAAPAAPTVTSPVVYCQNTIPAQLTATGTNLLWYTVPAGGAGSITAPTPSTAITGTTSYYVSQTSALGCESARAQIDVTVNTSPLLVITNPSPVCTPSTADLTDAAITAGSTGGNTLSYWSDAAATISFATPAAVSASGTYYIQSAIGTCTDIQSVTVVVNTTPVVGVTSATICSGSTATLTANGAASYSWSAGAASTGITTADASPLATNTYTVTGTDASGCSNTAVSTVTVNPLPIVTVNSPVICAGETASLGASGATSYSWSAGAIAFTVDSASATPLSTSSYTVTGTDLGCSNTAVSTVTVNLIPVLTVNSPTICPTNTVTLTANGATTYTWSAGATSTGINTADVTPAVTSSYTVTGITSGCFATAVATVTVNNVLVVTVNSPTICNGAMANLTAIGAATYTWTAGATPTGGANDNATASPAATTSYTVTGNNLGCTGTAVATVTVNQLPNVGVNSPTICSGQTANLIANGASTYGWSAGANSTGITTADASPIATTTYTVTGTDVMGCSNTATSSVTVNPLPVVTVNSPMICSGQTANLTANGAATYSWSAGANPGAGGNATASPALTTSYTVTGTTNGCSSNTVSTVTVNQNPTATVSGGGTVCIGTTAPAVNIALTGTGPWNITYNDGTSNSSIVAANSPYVINNPSAGNYTVTLISNTNCTGTNSGSATVAFTDAPTPLFTASPLSGCAPLCVSFSDASMPAGTIVAWDWSFGDGGTISQQSPSHCFNNGGNYSVTLRTTSANNCSSTLTIPNMITVNPLPVASFLAPRVSSITNPTVLFQDFSTNATSWDWNFGDPNSSANTSTSQNPAHAYTKPGNYCVLLKVSNGICIDTSLICLMIEPEFTFYIPNAFTPNNDGINDEFFGKGDNIKDFEMTIYDRWGNLLFYGDDISKHWDGKTKGGIVVQEDVYVYVINIKDVLNEEHKYIGSVSLVK